MPSPRLELPERLNVAALLCERAAERGWRRRPAFVYHGREISYGEVADGAARWAAALLQIGVVAEQRVLLALPDAPSFVMAFLGTLRAGAVAVPVDPYLPAQRHEYYLADSRAVAAGVAPWLVESWLEAAPRLPFLRHLLVCTDPGDVEGGEGDDSWRRVSAAAADLRVAVADDLLAAVETPAAADTHRDEPAFWLYTSGSTGAPKAAVHLQHDIVVAAECWGRCTLELGPDAVHLSASKMFFAYGLGNTLYCPLWTGGRSVLMPEKPAPGIVLDAIASHRVTHFYAVPSFYNALLTSSGFESRVGAGDLSSLEVCVSAGEALPAPLCRAWMERVGCPIVDGIGSTELLHIFISNRPDAVVPGASGRPIVGYEARIVAEGGSDAGVDEIGDLWIKGDSACAFYWNRHVASKRAIRGDWFVTGDKYRRDADGVYWYAGRADDMFKVHGKWVSPLDVESILLEHDGVREAAVVPSALADGLSRVVAYVVPTAAAAAGEELAAALRDHVAGRMSSHCVPAEIRFTDELPRTPTGKIQRFRLRD